MFWLLTEKVKTPYRLNVLILWYSKFDYFILLFVILYFDFILISDKMLLLVSDI